MKINNPINQSSKLLLSLSLLWALVLLMIGIWWTYLIFNFENLLAHSERSKISKMIIWEGGSFLVLLFLLSISLLMLYLKDQKKTKSLQAFFASLTHELKTPLASIRLQGEVIKEILESKNDSTLNKLSNRLIEDTGKLEAQMDKILQLSRVERGGELSLSTLKIVPFIKNISKKWSEQLKIEVITKDQEYNIIADEFALELIIKNLFENTTIHTHSKNVKIEIKKTNNGIDLIYQDHGEFNGDIKKLGTLFYKHNSKKGSGIGLYLSNKLLEKMRGRLLITGTPNLVFTLSFKPGVDLHA